MTTFYTTNPDSLKNCLEFIAQLKGVWKIGITKSKRSGDQNRLYWSYLDLIEKETGHRAESLHEFFKMDILGVREVEFKGKKVTVPKSTTGLSTSEFSEYLDEIIARVSRHGICLPSTEYYGMERQIKEQTILGAG